MNYFIVVCVLILCSFVLCAKDNLTYPIVDTGQIRCYDDNTEVKFPQKGDDYFGQDGHYLSNPPKYKDNGDGTVTDLVTGIMWMKEPGEKMKLKEALSDVKKCRIGGHRDWRVPTIKELYSLILFSGTDPDPMSRDSSNLKPFIDTNYFDFQYGREEKGERIIDSQYGSSTEYVGKTMGGSATLFGVNFADGRIKGYPRDRKEYYFIYVRGNKEYGKNDFKDNRDGTISDNATGLMWMKVDSGALKAGSRKTGGMNWEEAMEWAENLEYGGHSDWRLPNIKELQSIVDYKRSPQKTRSAAIDPVFDISEITNEGGKNDYPFFWSSSTHLGQQNANAADYIAFGEALGWMENRRTGEKTLMDVHGAGCQRSDPKSGDASRFPYGRGPQGDVIRINNYAICVRGGDVTKVTSGPEIEMKARSRGRERKGEQGREGGRSGGPEGGPSSFADRLDKDGDGKVSKDEFDGPKQHFSRFDKNGDGYITEDEAPKGPPPSHRR